MILMGDFNAKNEPWEKNKLDSLGQEIIDLSNKKDLNILCCSCTGYFTFIYITINFVDSEVDLIQESVSFARRLC